MFCASIALYLTVRKAALIKTPTKLSNLAMFAIPLLAYICIGIIGRTDMYASLWQAAVLVMVSLVFAYGGNKASLVAIEHAPNPGYSLVLSKSYVLFTTIVAVLFLHAELTLRRALAIVLIVVFSGLIMIDRKKAHQVTSRRWISLSLGAFFAWGMLSLSSKYLFNHGVETMAFLIYLYAIVTFTIIGADRVRIADFKSTTRQSKILLVAIGVLSTLFNLGNFNAIKLAPNVGYVNAINAGSIALVTVFAVVLFKDALTAQKAFGVLGVISGLVLLLI